MLRTLDLVESQVSLPERAPAIGHSQPRSRPTAPKITYLLPCLTSQKFEIVQLAHTWQQPYVRNAKSSLQ